MQNEIAERTRLDEQLNQLNYLYNLRNTLGIAQTVDGIVHRTGETMMDVLSASPSSGVHIQLDDRTWNFGETDKSNQTRYDRPLSWEGKKRGQLSLFCTITLSDSQKRALLDETAGQVASVLEARELQSQILQSARLVSMGQMAAGVAHELNQPLTAISTTAGDIHFRLSDNMDLPPQELKEMMETVLAVVDRMDETIDHLRVFSRDKSEELAIAFSVNDTIESSLTMIGTQLKNHNIALDLDLAKDLPSVMGHPYQMEQVILNLMGNARDALDDRDEENWQKQLNVRTRHENLRGQWVILEVEDNGMGIDEAHLDRLFEPFFTTKDSDKGTGLGLSISYSIVKNHNGELSCESQKGIGTTFRLALPIANGQQTN